jgi:hypothetical protein
MQDSEYISTTSGYVNCLWLKDCIDISIRWYCTTSTKLLASLQLHVLQFKYNFSSQLPMLAWQQNAHMWACCTHTHTHTHTHTVQSPLGLNECRHIVKRFLLNKTIWCTVRNTTLHVSGSLPAHHQELCTVQRALAHFMQVWRPLAVRSGTLQQEVVWT